MINQGDTVTIQAEVIRVCKNDMINVRLSDGQLVHIAADKVEVTPEALEAEMLEGMNRVSAARRGRPRKLANA